MNFEQEYSSKIILFEKFLTNYLSALEVSPHQAHQNIKNAIEYSLCGKGKRFRPAVALLVADCLGSDLEKILPWCLAVEMIHTYSLIHDDLPCMDNDDLRRGEPTNHKVYGEDVALLAGDALLTEAFLVIAKYYDDQAGHLVQILAEASGVRGMVGGQAIDLSAQKSKANLEEMNLIHKLKTGALIKASALGAAYIASTRFQDHLQMGQYGEHLGLAFQIADDLLDFDPVEVEPGSFPALLGFEGTEQKLLEVTQSGFATLSTYGSKAKHLMDLLEYNLAREK